jgi:hypothetical protein
MTTMITQTEIETYATKITEPDFNLTPENMLAVIGHLSQEEFRLVHARGSKFTTHGSRRRRRNRIRLKICCASHKRRAVRLV